ncbi:aldo/keto reductase [Salinarchaeum sp. Harcht-Bsk1]|uniref:aldo/keto reductase n=1 Tax=Salinarchaeum sp. Harcht-Bsk1 TaxID=1333523 RepID=UPI0003422833|nr:aldo/keto reductase [Salinarchaeum sp. Harcht-Bsk1]AGN02429.1 aldo/keto reductase [Salinarchaeum sp. Harcht-Bsk1]
MDTTPLGATGESVSELCLGPMYFGSKVDRETSFALLDRYYEAGGRFLDTANIYATWVDGYDEPESEPLVGEWLADRGVREEMTIATKLGFGYQDVPTSLDPELIHQEVDRSLERLGIDTIDLLYAHVDDPDTPQIDVMEAFGEAVDEGNVRHLGASNVPAWRVARANRIAAEQGLPRFECVQPRFSYLIPDRDAAFGGQLPTTDELVDYCTQHDLTLLPYSPTLQGCYGRDDRPIPDGYVRSENRQKLRVLEDIAEEKGVNGNTVALAWLLDRDQPTVPVLGVSTLDQLEQNLAAADLTFTDAERHRLNEIESYGFGEWDQRG